MSPGKVAHGIFESEVKYFQLPTKIFRSQVDENMSRSKSSFNEKISEVVQKTHKSSLKLERKDDSLSSLVSVGASKLGKTLSRSLSKVMDTTSILRTESNVSSKCSNKIAFSEKPDRSVTFASTTTSFSMVI